MGDMTDLPNERDIHEDDEDDDDHCIDCGRPIDYCCCGYYIPDREEELE